MGNGGTGGGRYWNEDAQRWEDGTADSAPVTPPPPARPDRAPLTPPAGVQDPDAPTSTALSIPPRPPSALGGGPAVLPPGEPGAVPAAVPAASPGDLVPPPVPSPYLPSAYGPAADGAWPPAAPVSVPAAPGGHSRRTVWTVIGASAAVGVAVSLVVTLGLGGGQKDHRGAAPASSTPATAGPSPTTYATEESATGASSPSPSADAPPAGYTSHVDQQGFRIAVPDGWTRSSVASQYGMDVVNFRSAGGDRRLQVYEVAESSPDESFNLYLSPSVPKPPGFRKLSLQNLDTGDFTGSRMEYLADSLKGEPGIGTWHVVDERFQAADGKLYAIASYGPEADGRADEREVLDTAVKWFCPPYTSCGS
ncbi:hypothetical protein [Streptomyces sp. NPDC046197]|uniref:hypothetical protein n=1 Tax=Streptomyces sp. NPDC046197 TaxID=3154337 RepID=UPI0033F4600E